MPYKDILVHVEGLGLNADHIETALQLAKRHDAHITGLYVLYQPDIPGYVQAQIGAEVIERQVRRAVEEADLALADFEKQAASEGLLHDKILEQGLCEDVLISHTRCADILVVGQNDPDQGQYHGDKSLPDRLILNVGRPVLIVPYAGRYRDIGKNVYIAWDGSRPAVRALNDALPILEMAEKVTVLSVNPPGNGQDDTMDETPGAGICQHLARHGIKAKADHVISDDVSGADMLLSRAADGGADLIVMGAYGHARWREVVLGGFTQHMLAHMTVPVLMAN